MFSDQVKDTTTTTGTGTITVSGTAPAGYFTFAQGYSVGDQVIYVIDGGSEREVVIGALLTSTTLSRVSVFRSTNSNQLVSFSAGTKSVFPALPADLAELAVAQATLMAARTLR